jgi:hypothetical protein
MPRKFCLIVSMIGIAAACVATPSRAADPVTDFFGAAICQPPYSMDSAQAIYAAAEKIAKPDMSHFGSAIYHLPHPITRDGFTAQDIVLTGSSYGVLLDGQVATEVAKRYNLGREKTHMLGTSTLGYARLLPDDQRAFKGLGLISIVAREGPAMAGKTLLSCELVSDEDRAALEALDKDDAAKAGNSPPG